MELQACALYNAVKPVLSGHLYGLLSLLLFRLKVIQRYTDSCE